MYSYGPPHMAKQNQDDQLEHTYSSYVRIRDVTLKTCQKRWTIGRSGERGSGISVLAARHDDELISGRSLNFECIWYSKFSKLIYYVFFVFVMPRIVCSKPCCQGLEYVSRISCCGVRHLPPKGVMGMTLNNIWWWGCCFKAFESMKSLFHWHYYQVHSDPEW